MREKPFTTGYTLEARHADGTAEVHEITISEVEGMLFSRLDEFGKVGQSLLEKLYEVYLPDTAKQDHIVEAVEGVVELSEKDTSKLSTIQKKIFQEMISSLNQDQADLDKKIRGLSQNQLLEAAEQSLKVSLEPDKVSIATVPGGVAVLVHDRTYFDEKFPGSETSGGFYRRSNQKSNIFDGKIFVVDATHSSKQEILKHEYLHLITANYIDPHEIPAPLSSEARQADEKLEELNIQIAELEEEFEYADYDDIANLRKQIEKLKKKSLELQKNKSEAIDKSSYFLTTEANQFFKDVRDELSAYAVSDLFSIKEDALIPRNSTWTTRLEKIQRPKDREKFILGWQKLKLVILTCIKKQVPPKSTLPIFLTSQNFDKMTKRLLLFLQDYERNQPAQPFTKNT